MTGSPPTMSLTISCHVMIWRGYGTGVVADLEGDHGLPVGEPVWVVGHGCELGVVDGRDAVSDLAEEDFGVVDGVLREVGAPGVSCRWGRIEQSRRQGRSPGVGTGGGVLPRVGWGGGSRRSGWGQGCSGASGDGGGGSGIEGQLTSTRLRGLGKRWARCFRRRR